MADLRNTKMRIEIPASKEEGMGRKEIKAKVEEAAALGIDTVKIIGDDPLDNPEIIKIVKDIRSIEGIKDISIATNGRLLGVKADDLAAAGLSRVTINTDTLQNIRYVGGDFDEVIAGINTATDANLKPVKINFLLKKGFNEDEVMDFVQLTLMHEYDVRFIEMSEEEEAACPFEFYSCEDVKKRLPALRPVDTPVCGIADVYKYPSARGKLCFIEKRAADFSERCAAYTVLKDGTVIR